jgi:Fe-S-cluster containining protein
MGEPDRVRVLRWVDAEDRLFLDKLGASLAEGARRAGANLVCRIACTECCVGSFPITPLDVRRLRNGFRDMSDRNPGRAAAVLARARASVAERDVEGPCPALDPQTGRCDLYDARPVTCRTFGLPVRIGGDRLPPCRLCFTSATPEALEDARVTIDEAAEEDLMIGVLEWAGIPDEDTTVAEALVVFDDLIR